MISGLIYKITSPTTKNIYVGSTRKTLSERLNQHKYDYTSYLKGTYNYVTSFDIIKGGNFNIECIEKYDCDNIKELSDREGYWIKTLQNVINKKVQGRTIKESRLNYYNNNKLILNQKHQCDHCGGSYSMINKNRHMSSKKHQAISI